MPIDSQDLAIPIKIKRRGILYFCSSHLLGTRIALPKDKQRISPRRAVYKRPLPMKLREMLHFVQHDKLRPHSHRLGVINARSGRSVAVSSWVQSCEV